MLLVIVLELNQACEVGDALRQEEIRAAALIVGAQLPAIEQLGRFGVGHVGLSREFEQGKQRLGALWCLRHEDTTMSTKQPVPEKIHMPKLCECHLNANPSEDRQESPTWGGAGGAPAATAASHESFEV